MCLLAEPSLGQFQRTLTVDPSGNADFTTIQGAIDSIADNPADKWTILLYAGVYDEAVTLDGTQENIDLIGVDRDACIIAPTGTDENGVTITSGTETSRHNTIRNITIRTTDGHGIEIRKGGGGSDQTPRDIIIEDCVVEADGEGMDGVVGSAARDVVVAHCRVQSEEDTAMLPGSSWTVHSSTILALGNGSATPHGIDWQSQSDLTVINCDVFSDENAIRLGSSGFSVERFVFDSTRIRSNAVGGAFSGTVTLLGASEGIFRSCVITNDSTLGALSDATAIFSDSTGGDNIRFQDCLIECKGGEATEIAIGFKLDQGGLFRFDNCVIVVSNEQDSTSVSTPARAVGIEQNRNSAVAQVLVTGGSITTSSSRERETIVYDVSRTGQFIGSVLISEARLSKWDIPVLSNGAPQSVVQRVLAASPAADGVVLIATSLTSSEQEIATGIVNPDVYRVLSVKGSTVGMTQTVYIVGTNFAGSQIADAIVLSGTTVVSGSKPFKEVAKIILPAQTGPGQTVSVGVSNKLGLQFPIGDTSDVIQIGRKAFAATSYTIETLANFTIDENFATVEPSSITSGDSFEFVVLASQ